MFPQSNDYWEMGKSRQWVRECPGGAVTKRHKLGALKTAEMYSSGALKTKIKVSAGPSSL